MSGKEDGYDTTPGVDPYLPHQELHVALDRVDADIEVPGDLLVAAVGKDQPDDLLLSLGFSLQRRKASIRFRASGLNRSRIKR